jgi:hypothetical protein
MTLMPLCSADRAAAKSEPGVPVESAPAPAAPLGRGSSRQRAVCRDLREPARAIPTSKFVDDFKKLLAQVGTAGFACVQYRYAVSSIRP